MEELSARSSDGSSCPFRRSLRLRNTSASVGDEQTSLGHRKTDWDDPQGSSLLLVMMIGSITSSTTTKRGQPRPPALNLRPSLPHCVRPGDVTVHGGSTEAVLLATTAGLAACVEAGYHIAPKVYDLGLPVYPETAE